VREIFTFTDNRENFLTAKISRYTVWKFPYSSHALMHQSSWTLLLVRTPRPANIFTTCGAMHTHQMVGYVCVCVCWGHPRFCPTLKGWNNWIIKLVWGPSNSSMSCPEIMSNYVVLWSYPLQSSKTLWMMNTYSVILFHRQSLLGRLVKEFGCQWWPGNTWWFFVDINYHCWTSFHRMGLLHCT